MQRPSARRTATPGFAAAAALAVAVILAAALTPAASPGAEVPAVRGAGASPAVAAAEDDAGATFTSVKEIFGAACAFSGCHTGKNPKRGLSLDPDRAYQEIVGVSSHERPELQRVAPGSPETSYLYLKITGDPSIDGRRMPRESPPLSDEEIRLVARWIERGAPDD